MRNFLTVEEAAAISRSSPALLNAGVGEKMRYLLAIGQAPGQAYYVDADIGDDVAYDGLAWDTPFKTIQAAINAAPAGSVIYIAPRGVAAGGTDPVSYAETLVIPNTKPGLSLVGYNTGRTQGGLPQIKKGSGAAALLTIRAPGCLIAGLGFNGGGSTGGGILLDDDGATKVAFGTSIIGCHFKNCVGSSATDGRTGGAIQWAATGGAWQVLIKGNRFYKNVADIVLLGAGGGVTVQDVMIEDNQFSGPPSSVDVNLWLGGNGITGLTLARNLFDALPALGGSVGRYMDLTACVGVMHSNMFGCVNTLTFKAASMGTAARVPATVLMADNWGENCTTPFVHTA